MHLAALMLVLSAAVTPEQVDALRAALAGAAASERPAMVERLLEQRAELIRGEPDDPRVPVWLADQAQDLFYLVLPIDASGLVTRFGLPTAAQRDRARRVARDMNELAGRAERAIDGAIIATESGRDGGLDASALAVERNRRLPFLRGIAMCLDADFNVEDAAARPLLYSAARARLEPVADLLPDHLAATARLYAGLASLGAADLETAAATLAAVAADPAARPDEVFAARMALARCRAARAVPDGLAALDGIDTGGNMLFRLIVADERFRLLRPTSPERAFDAYLALGEAALPRLIRVAGPGTPLDRLPPLVGVARAGNLAATPGGRAEAIELYERLLDSGRLDDIAGAAALFGLARVRLDTGDRVAAVRRLTELAQRYPASDRAEASIELAASLAAELNRLAPDDAATRALLDEVLGALLSRYPNLASVDRWRHRAGCLALDEARYEDAVHLFEAVSVDSDVRADAMRRRDEALRAWMVSTGDAETRQTLARRLLASADTGALTRAEALLALDDPDGALAALPPGDGDERAMRIRIEAYGALGRDDDIATAATAWLDKHGDDETLAMLAADACRRAGRYDEALRLYDKLGADHPDAVEVLVGRAECLYHLGTREEEAMDLYRRLATATAADLNDVYWRSQLRMLQILHRTGRNTNRIAPYIQQLRSVDPNLGGDRYRREFEQLVK